MSTANRVLLPWLAGILKDLKYLKRERALEVACGEGHVTREVLLGQFCEVDLFDPCPYAIAKVNKLKELQPKIG